MLSVALKLCKELPNGSKMLEDLYAILENNFPQNSHLFGKDRKSNHKISHKS